MRPRARPVTAGVDGGGTLAATEIGDAVHRLLEIDPARDVDVVGDWYPAVTAPELERIAALVDAYRSSDVGRRVARLTGAVREQRFTFLHDGVVLQGFLDLFHREDRRALVLDYKTNVLGEAAPADVVEAEYLLQRLVYALAALRAGAEEVEVIYLFLERPGEPVAQTFGRHDRSALEAELSAAIRRIRAGDFRPTPGELVCADCPALDVVCAGPRLGRAAGA